MLALTTKPEPRNLLIALAFFGLSTITSAWPDPGPASPLVAAEARRLVVGFAVVDFAVVAAAEAGRDRGVVVFLTAGSPGALADFRATVSSYPAGTARPRAG